VRPRKDYQVKKNGGSFQCWYKDQYLGSASSKLLCLLLAEKRGVKLELIQKSKNTEDSSVEG